MNRFDGGFWQRGLPAKLVTIAGLATPNTLIALDGDGNPYALDTSDLEIRLRKGTDAERQTVIFAEGEPVWTTDTKRLFVGDGETLGGIVAGPRYDEALTALLDEDGGSSIDVGARTLNGEDGQPSIRWFGGAGVLELFDGANDAWGFFQITDALVRISSGAYGEASIAVPPDPGSVLSLDGSALTTSRDFLFPNASGTMGVKVAVPATATSAGAVGTWAADNTHLYICTAANTWRRVEIRSW